MEIHARVIAFTRFLTSSWNAAAALCDEATRPVEFMENWEQANWELLVEWALGPMRFLPPLNDADIHDDSSRATHINVRPTDMILCVATIPLRDRISGELVDLSEGLDIDQFVSFDGEVERVEPPFDHVRVWTPSDERAVFRCDEVRFQLFPYREL